MFKVLIADDEPIIRRWFAMMIEAVSDDFEVIALAKDGKEVLDVCLYQKPDIIVTDIKMPIMDGLSLIKEVRKRYPEIKIIVLSAFDDFKFVRESLINGASDYLLKPEMTKEAVLNALMKVKSEIERSNLTKKNGNELGFYDVSVLIKDEFFRKLVDSKFDDEERISKTLQHLGINLRDSNLVLININIDNFKRLEEEIDKAADIGKSVFTLIEKKVLSINPDFFVFKYAKNKYSIIMNISNISKADTRNWLRSITLDIVKLVKSELNIDISAGISDIFNGFSKIKEGFGEADIALNEKFYCGKNSIIFYPEVLKDKIIVDKYIAKKIDECGYAFAVNDFTKLKKCIEELEHDVKHDCKMREEDLRQIAAEIVLLAVKNMRKFESSSSVLSDNIIYPFEEISKFDFLHDIISWVKNTVNKSIEFMESSDHSNIIRKVKNFIMSNYNKNISLIDISSQVHLSPSYLSRFFKSQTGIGLNQYITGKRIERAKTLLISTNETLYRIASEVGYPNVSYFVRVFKKYAGVTPAQFRNEMAK